MVALASILAAVAPPDGGVLLFLALFLLGYGWNLGYVAGSALLTHGLSLAERTRVQGLTDTLIWSSAAVASLGSGFVLAYAGYAILGLMGAALVIVPAMLVMRTPLGRHGRSPATSSPISLPDPLDQHARAGLDLVERHVLVCAVRDPDVARAEDHARRVAVVHEHLHVGAVRLAEERRPAARHTFDCRCRDRPATDGPTGPAPTRTARR